MTPRVLRASVWALALAAGPVVSTQSAQVEPPSLSRLERATREILRLTDQLRQEQLKSAACGGQLQELFARGYGAESARQHSEWQRAFEQDHPGWTFDFERETAVPRVHTPQEPAP